MLRLLGCLDAIFSGESARDPRKPQSGMPSRRKAKRSMEGHGMPCRPNVLILYLLGIAVCTDGGGCAGWDGQERVAAELEPNQCFPDEDFVSGFSEGLGRVEINGRRGFINAAGELSIPAGFDKAWAFSEGLAKACSRGRHGYIDKNGRFVIAVKFSDANPFAEGLAAAKSGSEWGFIDKSGHWAIRPQFQAVRHGFSEGLASVKVGQRWGYANKKGELPIPAVYEEAYDFRRGLAPVRRGGYWGYIDPNGKAAISFRFTMAEDFSSDPPLALVCIPGRELGPLGTPGFIDGRGNVAVAPKPGLSYDGFAEGLALAFDETDSNGHLGAGYIDRTGKWAIGPGFTDARPFCGGCAAVKVAGKWGYIDVRGKFVVEPQFDIAMPFQEHRARVCVKGEWGYIDRSGKFVWRPSR